MKAVNYYKMATLTDFIAKLIKFFSDEVAFASLFKNDPLNKLINKNKIVSLKFVTIKCYYFFIVIRTI